MDPQTIEYHTDFREMLIQLGHVQLARPEIGANPAQHIIELLQGYMADRPTMPEHLRSIPLGEILTAVAALLIKEKVDEKELKSDMYYTQMQIRKGRSMREYTASMVEGNKVPSLEEKMNELMRCMMRR